MRRRDFLKQTGAVALAAGASGPFVHARSLSTTRTSDGLMFVRAYRLLASAVTRSS